MLHSYFWKFLVHFIHKHYTNFIKHHIVMNIYTDHHGRQTDDSADEIWTPESGLTLAWWESAECDVNDEWYEDHTSRGDILYGVCTLNIRESWLVGMSSVRKVLYGVLVAILSSLMSETLVIDCVWNECVELTSWRWSPAVIVYRVVDKWLHTLYFMSLLMHWTLLRILDTSLIQEE
jgi:hypothetical protein